MVLVPDLSGLTNNQAEAAIIAAGLTYSGSSSTTTNNQSLANQIVSQLPNANDLVPYESGVSFIYYNYVATTTTTTTTTTSPTTTSGPPPTTSEPIVATISNLTYSKTGASTGTLSWSGSNINVYRYTGDSSLYPAPYNYGTYTSSWPGNLVNLVEGQSYTVTIDVRSVNGYGNSQSITFTHPVATTAACLNTYTLNFYTQGQCRWTVRNCSGTIIYSNYITTTCESPGVDSSGATIPGCSGTCPETTTTTTTTTTTSAPTGSVIYSIGSSTAAACSSGYSTSSSGSGTGGSTNVNTPCGSFYVPYGVPYGWRCCSANTTTTSTTAASTTTTTTTAGYPTLLSGWHLCAQGDVPNPSSPCIQSNVGTRCVDGGASGASCPDPNATTAAPNCTPVYSYSEYRASCGATVDIYVNPCTGAESFTCPTTAAPTTTTTQNPASSCDTPGQVVNYGGTPSCGPGCTTTSSGSGTGTGSLVVTPCGTLYGVFGVPYSWKCCG